MRKSLDTDGFLKNKVSLLVLPKSGGEGKCPQLAPLPPGFTGPELNMIDVFAFILFYVE